MCVHRTDRYTNPDLIQQTNMAAGGLDDHDPLLLRCFPPLVFAEEIKDNCFGLGFGFGSGSSNHPKMLCFGDFDATNSGRDCTSISSTTLPKSYRKRKGSGDEPDTNLGRPSGAPTGSSKKAKSSTNPTHSVASHAKIIKKEKLGERITALQQLVSPFGKTDTASVLHETYGYIRFLQDQVQVLCSPFLHRRTAVNDQETVNCQKKNMTLRTKGLCLVPIELTLHVGNESNGADLWSSAEVVNNLSLIRL